MPLIVKLTVLICEILKNKFKTYNTKNKLNYLKKTITESQEMM